MISLLSLNKVCHCRFACSIVHSLRILMASTTSSFCNDLISFRVVFMCEQYAGGLVAAHAKVAALGEVALSGIAHLHHVAPLVALA